MARGSINKVILIGRLGQDPEVRTTASGTMVVGLNLATNENGPQDPNTGQRQEVTEWHKIVLFNKAAEIAAQYLKKGDQCYIEGRLQTRKWTDQNGQDRYTTEIIGNELQFIGGSQNSQQQRQGGQQYQQQGQPVPQQQYQQPQQGYQQPQRQAAPQQQPQRQAAPQQGYQQPQGQQFQQPQGQQPAPQAGGGFDDFDDDIPF